jgi:Domain of unknown function (DUF4249)
MKKRFPIYFIILLGIIASCITPLTDFQQLDSKVFLTIESSLTDQSGPHSVQITFSSASVKSATILPVKKASVYLTDDKGIRENFLESTSTTQQGMYLSSANFRGKIGNTYVLHIETADGKKYISSPETMPPVPDIEQPTYQFEAKTNYAVGDPRRGGFNVYINAQDSPKLGEYYQWYWKHYERASICATCPGGEYNFTKNVCQPPPTTPVPPGSTPATAPTLNYYCDGDCWDIVNGTDINVLSDTYLNGKPISGKQVARAPFDGISPYYLQIEQRGITQSSFDYQQGIANQLQNSGTFFDVPAETRFNTNLKSSTNSTEKILGIFNVYSVKKKIVYIDRTKGTGQENPVISRIDGEIFVCNPPSLPCKDKAPCFESKLRTKIKPEGWVN